MQPAPSNLAVQTVSIGDGQRVLRLTFSDGQSLAIEADRLRSHCRCAICTRARFDGTFVPKEGLQIEQAAPIGQYGLNLAFSDGHTRGIYPFAFLAELAATEVIADRH